MNEVSSVDTAPIEKVASGKTTSLGVPGALGAALMGGVNIWVDDVSTRAYLAMVVPFAAVLLAEGWKYTFSLHKADPAIYKLRSGLKRAIKNIEKEMKQREICEDRRGQLRSQLYDRRDALNATYDSDFLITS